MAAGENTDEINLRLVDHPTSNRPRKIIITGCGTKIEIEGPPSTIAALVRALSAENPITSEAFIPYQKQAIEASKDGRSKRSSNSQPDAALSNAIGDFRRKLKEIGKTDSKRSALVNASLKAIRRKQGVCSWMGLVEIEGESPEILSPKDLIADEDLGKLPVAKPLTVIQEAQRGRYSHYAARFPEKRLESVPRFIKFDQVDWILVSDRATLVDALPDGTPPPWLDHQEPEETHSPTCISGHPDVRLCLLSAESLNQTKLGETCLTSGPSERAIAELGLFNASCTESPIHNPKLPFDDECYVYVKSEKKPDGSLARLIEKKLEEYLK